MKKKKTNILLGTYWDRRAIESVQKNYKDTQEFLEYVDDLFRRSQMRIERDVIYRLERLAHDNELSLHEVRKRLNRNELRDFKMSLSEYIRRGTGTLDDKTLKELRNASNLFHVSQLQAMETEIKAEIKTLYAQYEKKTGEVLRNMYEDSYYRTAYDLQTLSGYKHITRLNPKKMDLILNKPWASDQRSFSKRLWGNSNVVTNILHKELGIGIALGEHPSAIAKRLTDKIAISRRAAYRLAHTEAAYFTEQASADSYKDHNIKEYQILATLDSKTSRICRAMDLEVFDTKDRKTGVNYPPFHPNCRTTTIPYFDDLGGERAARDPVSKKTVYVDGNMNYSEWKRRYVA